MFRGFGCLIIIPQPFWSYIQKGSRGFGCLSICNRKISLRKAFDQWVEVCPQIQSAVEKCVQEVVRTTSGVVHGRLSIQKNLDGCRALAIVSSCAPEVVGAAGIECFVVERFVAGTEFSVALRRASLGVSKYP